MYDLALHLVGTEYRKGKVSGNFRGGDHFDQARQAALMKKEACDAEVASRESKVSKMKATTGTKTEKIQEQERELNAAKEHAHKATNDLDRVTQRLQREIPRYQRERREEVRSVFLELATVQAQMHRSNSGSWRELLGSLSE